MIIRRAKIEDTARIVELSMEMLEMSNWEGFNLDPKKIGTIIDFSTDKYSSYFACVYEEDGEVQGFFLGTCTPCFFSEDLVGNEMCFYVNRDHRSYLVASAIVKAFDEFCAERSAKRITIGSSAGVVSMSYLKFLEKLGFKQAGFVAIKN